MAENLRHPNFGHRFTPIIIHIYHITGISRLCSLRHIPYYSPSITPEMDTFSTTNDSNDPPHLLLFRQVTTTNLRNTLHCNKTPTPSHAKLNSCSYETFSYVIWCSSCQIWPSSISTFHCVSCHSFLRILSIPERWGHREMSVLIVRTIILAGQNLMLRTVHWCYIIKVIL